MLGEGRGLLCLCATLAAGSTDAVPSSSRRESLGEMLALTKPQIMLLSPGVDEATAGIKHRRSCTVTGMGVSKERTSSLLQ